MVDDENDLVWTVTRQFQRRRPTYSFVGLSDPVRALAEINSDPPDLLITDVRMPSLSGVELIRTARIRDPSMPVIVITAFGTSDLRRELEGIGSIRLLESLSIMGSSCPVSTAFSHRKSGSREPSPFRWSAT